MAFGVTWNGRLALDRPLDSEHNAYLQAFHLVHRTRVDAAQLALRPDILRTAVGLPVGPEGAYYVGSEPGFDDPANALSLDEHEPPVGQPSVLCPWMPTEDGQVLILDETHDCVRIVEWLHYILEHFLVPWGYVLNGNMLLEAKIEDDLDRVTITVEDNSVHVATQQPDGTFGGPVHADIYCVHKDAPQTKHICTHLVGKLTVPFCRWFIEAGRLDKLNGARPDEQFECVLVCPACYQHLEHGETEIDLRKVCRGCYTEIENWGYFDGFISTIAVRERDAGLHLALKTVQVPWQQHARILVMQPLTISRESEWIAILADGEVVRLNLTTCSVTSLLHLPSSDLRLDQRLRLRISPDGECAALVNVLGRYGFVLDLKAQRVTRKLERDDYHSDVSNFPLAFFVMDDRTLLVHGTEWNRLDISDPITGECLTQRPSVAWTPEKPPQHYLDYFHAGLIVSPNQEWLVDDGWVWQPHGMLVAYRLRRWLHENVWETEDTTFDHQICVRDYWDRALCWIDGHTLAVWGYGDGEEWLLPAVRIFDVETTAELRWFLGPSGVLVFDNYLYSFSADDPLAVWDVETGERLLHIPDFSPSHYHPGVGHFLRIGESGTFVVGQLNADPKNGHSKMAIGAMI
ncbi:hypothetical protein ccbrp13_55250 [Ktedonobacteria bacterium brp13]|nr:hypothetical protein ccbrp13_55250 [Ktedonobacteria bacterium brp13]